MNNELQDTIEKLTENVSLSDLTRARDTLTMKYRNPLRFGKTQNLMISELERLSYLVTRMPATYAVVVDIFEKIKHQISDLHIESMLDLGAGPGTALFAALEKFPELKHAHLIEKDPDLIKLGKLLSNSLADKSCLDEWQIGNIRALNDLKQYDLVTISYAMNELETSDQKNLIEKAFKAALKILVIIEPGSMEGFRLIKETRDQLIKLGGKVIAPCPHSFQCPMPENDWCHFSKRLARTSTHRQLKKGSLGHEDEKFSYIVVAKSDIGTSEDRIIAHPEKHSGHLSLRLCTKKNGIINKTLSKKDGELYKQARKLEWGDSFSSK